MMVGLSILIPSVFDRNKKLSTLLISIRSLADTIFSNPYPYHPHWGNSRCMVESLVFTKSGIDVQVLALLDNRDYCIGWKRNELLHKMACGKYVCFIDDDDRIGENYISLLLEGIEKNVDCCSLTGEITTDGKNPKKFIHSIEYNTYFEKDEVYYRPPNHLNCIKADIARQFRFPETNHGEDTDWAMQICRSGLLKTEHPINETIYYYDYLTNK